MYAIDLSKCYIQFEEGAFLDSEEVAKLLNKIVKLPKDWDRFNTYAALVEMFDVSTVAKMTGYAESTMRNYSNKGWDYNFRKWFQKFFDKCYFIDKPENIVTPAVAYILTNEIGQVKVGFTTRFEKRKEELEKTYNLSYKTNAIFRFSNVEDAYEMEIWLHRFYKKKGGILLGNSKDHFNETVFEESDLELLVKIAESIPARAKEFGLA